MLAGNGAPAPGNGDLVHLFERARQALAARLQLEPEIAEALALPIAHVADLPPALQPGTAARLTAQIVVDERARRVVVRVVDVQTGTTVREFPPAALAAVAAKIGQEIANATPRDALKR